MGVEMVLYLLWRAVLRSFCLRPNFQKGQGSAQAGGSSMWLSGFGRLSVFVVVMGASNLATVAAWESERKMVSIKIGVSN